MRREQTIRRVRSGWWSLWLFCLLAWTTFGAWYVYDLGARYDQAVSARAKTTAEKAGARIGATLGYNAAINRFAAEWGTIAAILLVFLAMARGRTVIEERWLDQAGRPVPPDRSPRRPS